MPTQLVWILARSRILQRQIALQHHRTSVSRRVALLAGALAAALATGLSACASAPGAASTASVPVADSTATWPGVYLGTLPCADCEGIETALLLRRDATFQLATKRLGAKDSTGALRVHHGRVGFNRAHTEITLDSLTDAPNRYAIGDGQLVQLDSVGKPIAGELAARYVLKKQVTAGTP